MDSKMLRQKARENLSGNWGLSIGVAAVAVLLGGLMVGTSFLPELNFSTTLTQTKELELFSGFRISFKNGALGMVGFILGGVIQLGYAKFLLNQHDKKEMQFGDLFSEFDRFGQGFAQHFLRSLYTFLWALLFIIPGIVKSYSYAMTPYLMAESPDLTASEAITLSKQMMDGHKGELFILDLTFIGWGILCILTLNLGHLALNPYHNAARTAFYRELKATWRQDMGIS